MGLPLGTNSLKAGAVGIRGEEMDGGVGGGKLSGTAGGCDEL